jgi:hypothetical protein
MVRKPGGFAGGEHIIQVLPDLSLVVGESRGFDEKFEFVVSYGTDANLQGPPAAVTWGSAVLASDWVTMM